MYVGTMCAVHDPVDTAGLALLELGRALRGAGYTFTTVTPATHARVNARAAAGSGASIATASSLRDVFGWSRPFAAELVPESWLDLLRAADAVACDGSLLRSRVRYSSLGDGLFVHSAFPTLEADAVFFGPDTYRFCELLRQRVQRARCVVDIGCGSGAGGLSLAGVAERVVLTDISPRALALAEVNAALCAVPVELVRSDVLRELGPVARAADLFIANPPYMRDPQARVYRDGGGDHGEALSLRIVHEVVARMSPGARLVLYTGVAIVDGVDALRARVASLLGGSDLRWTYQELDPDVFGDELEQPGYEDVDRIAVVALCVQA